MSSLWILSPVLVAWLAGAFLLIWSFAEHLKQNTPKEQNPGSAKRLPSGETSDGLSCERGLRAVHGLAIGALSAAALLALWAAWSGDTNVIFFYLMKDIPIYFQVDGISRWFVTLVTVVWVLVGIYSTLYMRHEGEEKRFFGFYLLLYGVLVCLNFAGNLVTMYLFYEFMTLTSFPLVLHNGSREAIMAALKYLFYSLCGAYMGLFGIFFLYRFCGNLTFVPGGILSQEVIGRHGNILLTAVMLMLIGFGAKAGMFPLHAWLPTAHPVAPSPASAVLSGIIVKSGVLAVIRVVYYIVGPDFLRGTWVQYTWMALSLTTIFMGSLLAYREPILKKRLAYSTVSNLSYILFGLAVLSPTGFSGALLHVVFHGVVKCGLFLTAGIFLFCHNKTKVEELAGIGQKMPVVLWCYTLLSLSLIGIPPTGGFVSKWHLAQGALEANMGPWSYAGPIILLISALLTAGYLLPLVIKGFFPGESTVFVQGKEIAVQDEKIAVQDKEIAIQDGKIVGHNKEIQDKEVSDFSWESAANTAERFKPQAAMLIPLLILTVLSLVMGLFPNVLIEYTDKISMTLFR